jgi:hypothetical protein
MIPRNIQAKKPANADIEMAVRAVEGVPNAMDMDLSGIDPEPTFLDLATAGDGLVTDERRLDHQHRAEECIVCGQPLDEG